MNKNGADRRRVKAALASCVSHLYAALGEAKARCQLLPGVDVWVVTLLEDLLQLRYLVRCKGHPRLPLSSGFSCKRVTITVVPPPSAYCISALWLQRNSPAQTLLPFGDSSPFCAFSTRIIKYVDKLRAMHFISLVYE